MKNAASRNQRVSNQKQRRQQHVLEVTIRRDKAVAQRNRAIFFTSCKVLFYVALVVGIYLGGKEGLRRFLWENPEYFLSDVRVATDGALTREQIVAASGVVEGRNIFTVDLAKAHEALEHLPQVERVEIQRVLPNRVNISVTERRPIAWVISKADEDPTSSEKSFLIDARGVVMRSKTVLPEYLHLPVISGVEVDNLAAGQRVQTFEMQAALDLVRLNADSTRFQARNIDLAKGYCLVVTDRTHAQITFGLDRVDQQLDRLNRLLDRTEPVHRELQTVNLLVERNMPVTFAEPVSETEMPPIAAPPKTISARDKFLAAKATPTPAKKAVSATPTPIHSKKDATPGSRKSPADGVKKRFNLNG